MNKTIKHILKILIILFFTLGISTSIYLYFSGFNFELFFQNLHLNIYSKIIIILIIFIFRNYFFIPSTVVILLSGFFLQNFLLGFVVNTIGVGIGIIQTYMVGYVLGEGFNKNKLFNKILKYKNKIKENGFQIIFIGAFFPIITVDILYYTAGIIRYNVIKCLIAGLLGELPLILLYSYLGKEANKYKDYVIYVAIILIILFVFYYYIKKSQKKHN